MTISVKHTFQSPRPDGTDTALIQPSNWNADHVLTAAAGKVLGRDTSGAGNVQELPIAVDSSGNVAIGTATPTVGQKLTVAGGVQSVSGGYTFPDGTTQTSAAGSSAVSYPQNIQSANYTLVLGDAGKQVFHPASDASTRTYTIPANASVAFPIGTVVLFTVENGGKPVSVAITSDTLVQGNGITGSASVLANNTLMCIKVTATKWMANYLYQAPMETQSIAVGNYGGAPHIQVYPWSSAGFGIKFTNPVTALPSEVNGVAFSPSGDAIAMAISDIPWVVAYPWNGSGFGTKFANPATQPPSYGLGVAFSPTGNAIAVAHAASPFVSAYPWSSSGFGTKFANPATLPPSTGNSVAFNPAGDAIAVGHASSPNISVYSWSGSGFGTKFANPATLPIGQGKSVTFNPAGNVIAVAHDGSPYVSAYPWSGSGFGTKFADPSTLPANNGSGVAFNPAGDAIAVSHTTTPFVSAYPWSGSGFGTKFANPATLPAGTGYGVAFSLAGDAIAVAHATTPFVSAYQWSNSGFGTKLANPAALPTNTGSSVAFAINP